MLSEFYVTYQRSVSLGKKIKKEKVLENLVNLKNKLSQVS